MTVLRNSRNIGGVSIMGRSYLIPTLRLRDGLSLDAFDQELAAAAARAPGLYRNSPVVVDVSAVTDVQELGRLCEIVRRAGMTLAGITGVQDGKFQNSGLPLLTSGRPVASASNKRPAESTLVIPGNIRGGQQVYGHGSVTVLGSVHEGAEVIADGDIHVLGTLKGRALAGVTGNKSAIIAVTQFKAQLVSIADVYMACEENPNGVIQQKPTRVILQDGQLSFLSQSS